jgi:hypothetical protein
MSLTYVWKLLSLKKTNVENFQDVIINAQWKVSGTDEENYSGTFYGASPLNVSQLDPNSFINFDNLTEEIVLGWIEPQVNGAYWDHVVNTIQEQIKLAKNPVVEVPDGNFPWVSHTIEE